jgi:hypothetical protein
MVAQEKLGYHFLASLTPPLGGGAGLSVGPLSLELSDDLNKNRRTRMTKKAKQTKKTKKTKK